MHRREFLKKTAAALRSAEVPVRMRARLGGESSINASQSAYYMVKVLLAIFVGLFRARPTVARAIVPAMAGFSCKRLSEYWYHCSPNGT